MGRAGRIVVWVLGSAVATAILAVAGVYVASERILRRTHDAPLPTLGLPRDPPSLELGQRRATLVGCYRGCHGRDAEGDTWVDEPGLARLSTPNLTQLLPAYSDAELARLLRYGVRRDGTTALDMPSYMFYHMDDADLAAIIAFLRTLPPRPGPARLRELGWRGRWKLLTGEWTTSAADVDRGAPRAGELPRTTSVERGRYAAMITCPECHAADLEGFPGDTPSLRIVAAYSREEFHTLMRTGLAKGGRELGLMSQIGRIRTPTLTDEEVDDLYAFLRSRAGAPSDEP